MTKILHVAVREFVATAMTKAFIIGAFVVPGFMFVVMIFGYPLLHNEDAPEVEGELAVIDRTGRVVGDIADRLRPEAIAARNRDEAAQVAERIEETVGVLGDAVTDRVAEELEVPRISVVSMPENAEVESEKGPLRQGATTDPGSRLALAVVDRYAVTPDDDGEYGGYELYVRGKLDDRVEREIRTSIKAAIQQERIVAAELDPEVVRSLTTIKSPRTREVTATGERTSLGVAALFVPFGFMAVLMISVMIGGQYLLTTTVEEKSSRVVEVLLSALSPMELMTGKIAGQLCVGLTILITYGSIGGGALILFGLADLLGILRLIYMIIFFLIAYVTIGAMMAAVGSAVNDMREAQSLQGPVMIVLIIPYMLGIPISRDPNSLFATIISFLPPVSPFVMMLRITSTEPPPTWQILLSILVGLVGVYVAVWAAAKIFRIGLLMFGKPPNLITLIRWVRMA